MAHHKVRRNVMSNKNESSGFITVVELVQILQVLAEAVHARGGNDSNLCRVLSERGLAEKFAELVVDPAPPNISLLKDDDLPQTAMWNGVEVNPKELIGKLRPFWQEQMGYSGKACGVLVRRDFRLKESSKEWKNCPNLRRHEIEHEIRTHDVIFLSPPAPCGKLSGSRRSRAQKVWFRSMEQKYDMPENILVYGKAQSVVAFLLAQQATAGVQVGEQRVYFRTNSNLSGDGRCHLGVYWEEGQLTVDYRYCASLRMRYGCLAGVELTII
jgi:hypothetical protein